MWSLEGLDELVRAWERESEVSCTSVAPRDTIAGWVTKGRGINMLTGTHMSNIRHHTHLATLKQDYFPEKHIISITVKK